MNNENSNGKGNLPSIPVKSGSLLDAAFQNLSEVERQKLLSKALEKKLELEVEKARATERHDRSGIDMHNTVRHIRDIESSTNSDYTVRASFETASGNTSVEVRKSNNTATIIIVVVVGIVLLILFGR